VEFRPQPGKAKALIKSSSSKEPCGSPLERWQDAEFSQRMIGQCVCSSFLHCNSLRPGKDMRLLQPLYFHLLQKKSFLRHSVQRCILNTWEDGEKK